MYKKILVAVDGSAGSENAAKAAAEIARLSTATICALYAYEQPPFYGEMQGGSEICGMGGLEPKVFDDLLDIQNERVRKAADSALAGQDLAYNYRMEIGRPAQTVVQIAEEIQCDLIVVGSRGLGGIASFLLGSVSERIAHLAHCSVLIVR